MAQEEKILRDSVSGDLYAVIEENDDAVVARSLSTDDVHVFDRRQLVPDSAILRVVGIAVQSLLFADYRRLQAVSLLIYAGAVGSGLSLLVGWLYAAPLLALVGLYCLGGFFGVVIGALWNMLKNRHH